MNNLLEFSDGLVPTALLVSPFFCKFVQVFFDSADVSADVFDHPAKIFVINVSRWFCSLPLGRIIDCGTRAVLVPSETQRAEGQKT